MNECLIIFFCTKFNMSGRVIRSHLGREINGTTNNVVIMMIEWRVALLAFDQQIFDEKNELMHCAQMNFVSVAMGCDTFVTCHPQRKKKWMHQQMKWKQSMQMASINLISITRSTLHTFVNAANQSDVLSPCIRLFILPVQFRYSKYTTQTHIFIWKDHTKIQWRHIMSK